jgi:hypothetical protein
MLSILLSSLLAGATPYDCSKFKPFPPLAILRAEISVHRLQPRPDELVCQGMLPVYLKDIRGREADWYFCDHSALTLKCETDYLSKPATMEIRPAMVIRGWNSRDVLDAHMHIFLLPENDESRLLDTFAQALGFDLGQREMILNGASGGRAPAADQDSFYVRVHFRD